MAVPMTKPLFSDDEAHAVADVLSSGWVTQGPQVAAFEEEFAGYVGADYACAVSSCTTALHLALIAAGVEPGDEVITASHSFIATANSVRYCGAIPVFVDIQPDTYNMDPVCVEAAITSATRAILVVHQMGMPCDMGAIKEIGVRHNLPVVEDAACAIGSEIASENGWAKIGQPHGQIACFSFHPRKVITTGDGGMLTTNDPEIDRRFRLLRQHGMSVPDTVRHASAQVVFESYPVLGYNYRMTDIQAAIGRVQLQRLPEIIARRRFLAARYDALLADIPGLGLPLEPSWARSNWQSFCVRLPAESDQRQVMQAMLDAGVASRRGIMCAHREPAYADEPWSCGSDECDCGTGSCMRLRHSEEAQDQTVVLPLFPQMTEEEQDLVVQALHEACLVRVR